MVLIEFKFIWLILSPLVREHSFVCGNKTSPFLSHFSSEQYRHLWWAHITTNCYDVCCQPHLFMQLLWKGLRPISSHERFQSPGVGSWKGKQGGGGVGSLHSLWERNWHRKWSHMAQIYCVRDFPFKSHYIHCSEQWMAQLHSFWGLASDEITALLSSRGDGFIIPWWESQRLELYL